MQKYRGAGEAAVRWDKTGIKKKFLKAFLKTIFMVA